jgi:hypothetical protein
MCFRQLLSACGVCCVLQRKIINRTNVMGTEMCTRMVPSLTVVHFSDGFSVQFNPLEHTAGCETAEPSMLLLLILAFCR